MKKTLIGKTFSIITITMVMLAGSAQAIAPPPACVLFTDTNITVPGIRLVYQLSGRDAVRHDVKEIIEGDKITVESTIPVVENGVVVGNHTYTQQIHRGSRQVIWTSEPIANRALPGVLPQSDYTDLWIPPATPVGSYVNIQNQTLSARDVDAQNISVGSRIYDRNTGVLTGVTAPESGITLSPILQCESAPVQPPPALGDAVMGRAFVTSTPYYLSERAVLHALFTSPVPPSQPVLLDLELYNAQNEKIAQSFFDNVVVTSTESLEKILDVPRYLPKGTYTFKVGIFNPGWNGLIHWYDNTATFALAELGQYEDGDVRMGTALANPPVIQAGQNSTLLASFVSPTTQNHMFLDLELVNSHGETVAQAERDNVSINRNGTGNYENIYTLAAPTTLSPGTYTFTVGIYTLGKAALIHSYPNAATLIVQ